MDNTEPAADNSEVNEADTTILDGTGLQAPALLGAAGLCRMKTPGLQNQEVTRVHVGVEELALLDRERPDLVLGMDFSTSWADLEQGLSGGLLAAPRKSQPQEPCLHWLTSCLL